MSDLKSRIIEADDRPYEDVDIEEWGATVRVRGLSGAAAESFSRKFGSQDEGPVPDNIMAALLVRTLENPDTGETIFSDDETDVLADKSAKVLSPLFRKAQELSGLGDIEDTKNF